jgi:hypothetical protein
MTPSEMIKRKRLTGIALGTCLLLGIGIMIPTVLL